MKQIKRFSQTFVAGALGLAVLIGLNVFIADMSLRWDATENKRNSITGETAAILGGLNSTVHVLAFYPPQDVEAGRSAAEDLLKLFAARTERFSYEFIDPDRSPSKVKQYKVKQIGTVVLTSGDKSETVVFPDEEKLINALVRVSNPKKSIIYFVTGHGELDPAALDQSSCQMFKKTLTDQGAALEKLTLAREKSVPEDADVLLILGPKKDFLKHELDLLTGYFSKGGRIFAALSAEDRTSFDVWLEKNMEIKVLDGLVVDKMGQLLAGNALTPVVQSYGFSPVTRDFNLLTGFPTAAGLSWSETPGGADPIRSLAKSNEQTWLETNLELLRQESKAEYDSGADKPGPIELAAVFQGKEIKGEGNSTRPGPRAVVFADQDWISNTYVNLAGNMDLARNSMNWLMEREGLIRVSKPKGPNVFLKLSPGEWRLLLWTPTLLLPGAALVLAVIVAVRRRRSK